MRLNWMAHRYIRHDGYGRFGTQMIRALHNLGADVKPMTAGSLDMPGWMWRLADYDFSRLTIQCMPVFAMKKLPGRVWGLTMTEDDSCPPDWADAINGICERLIVPCEHNAEVFKRKGVSVPIDVIYGGTSPDEFPVLPVVKRQRPYTFLALADRGNRKGFMTVYRAFYRAFGQNPDVRLVLKMREGSNWLTHETFAEDRRVTLWMEDTDTMADVYAQIDCFAFASYGEGWGMPPREAAMMGLPVIATRYSGLEPGLDCWGIPIEKFEMQKSSIDVNVDGMWAVPDLDEVTRLMQWCYEHENEARRKGLVAAQWLRENQTWEHSARALMDLMAKYPYAVPDYKLERQAQA